MKHPPGFVSVASMTLLFLNLLVWSFLLAASEASEPLLFLVQDLLFVFVFFVAPVGVILGIIAVVRRERYAWVGLIGNLLMVPSIFLVWFLTDLLYFLFWY